LSIDIRDKEFFTLLGPSGCAKTTLRRMIAGFNTIEGGDFFLDDRRINGMEASKRNSLAELKESGPEPGCYARTHITNSTACFALHPESRLYKSLTAQSPRVGEPFCPARR
jgi:ABC-type uncharacterized transport system ATPase component